MPRELIAYDYEKELRTFVSIYLACPEQAKRQFPSFDLEFKFLSEDLPENPYRTMRGRFHHLVDCYTWDCVMSMKKELEKLKGKASKGKPKTV